jgi:outer membrane murein-binding lipoprotein Lpp
LENLGDEKGWKASTVALAALFLVFLVISGGLGYLYLQDQSKIQSLSSQLDSVEAQVQNLNSQVSNLNAENAGLSSRLSLYESSFPLLKAAWTCNGGSGIAFELTNVGNQSITVPASGVRVLAPNGTQYMPTPGHQVTFYVYSSGTCVGGLSTPGTQTSVVVPAGGNAWIEITDTSLLGLGASGNYIVTFDHVTTSDGKGVSVDPVWIGWTQPTPAGIVLGYVTFPATGQQGLVFLTNNSPYFLYLTGASLTYAGASCSVSVTPPWPFGQDSGRAWQWGYSNGDPCPGSPASPGEQFAGYVVVSNEEQVAFSGTFG